MERKEQCLQLYRRVFGADPVFDGELFAGYFDRCRYLTEAGAVTAMLFALPCRLYDGVRDYPAEYLFAAATAPECRGGGRMTRLLDEVCSRPDVVYLLKPANAGLIDFYRARGFLPFRAVRAVEGARRITVDAAFRTLARDDIADGSAYTAMYRYPGPLALDGLAFSYLME